MNISFQSRFSDTNLEHQKTYIRSFSKKIDEQAGQLFAEFLSGLLVLQMAENTSDQVRSQGVNRKSDKVILQATMKMPEKLMTAYEVAERLNMSKAKAYQLMRTGRIPSVQFDRTTRVREQDLEKFINDHIVQIT